MLLDSQDSLVDLDFLVRVWGPMSPDQQEILDSLGWMESMVSRVLQVRPGPLVQARHRETEETPGCQGSPAPPAVKENLDSPRAPEASVSLVPKEHEVTAATAEVLVSKVSPVTPVTLEVKDPRDCEGELVGRVSPESPCRS